MFKYMNDKEQLRNVNVELTRLKSKEKQTEAVLVAIKKLIRVDELSEDELLDMIDLYDDYQVDKQYKEDDIFKYEGKLYKVIQEHTSQDDWIPSELPALYLNMMPENIIPEWRQPTGSHDSYNIGDKVIFEGMVYESLIDGNIWSPTDYPQGWKLV